MLYAGITLRSQSGTNITFSLEKSVALVNQQETLKKQSNMIKQLHGEIRHDKLSKNKSWKVSNIISPSTSVDMFNGSSETIRKTTRKTLQSPNQGVAFQPSPSLFNFAHFRKELPQHKTRMDQEFLEWFVGFAEGDGSFQISPAQKAPKGLTPPEPLRLFFIITQKEVQVLHMIRSTLGFGRVTAHGDEFRYIVADLEYIDKILHIFNGNILISKVNRRFEDWVYARNTIHSRKLSPKSSKPPIQLLERFHTRLHTQDLIRPPFFQTGWLSGFTDADGCFNISKRKDSKHTCGFRVRCRYILDQKEGYDILEKIKQEMDGGFYYRRLDSVEEMYRYECSSFRNLDTAREYFQRYPLRSRKRFSCGRLFKMLNYMQMRKKLPWTGKVLQRINRLIATRNVVENDQEIID